MHVLARDGGVPIDWLELVWETLIKVVRWWLVGWLVGCVVDCVLHIIICTSIVLQQIY